jgi:hypothetical protein
VSHDQAAELLGLLEGSYPHHNFAEAGEYLPYMWNWPRPFDISPELWASMQRQKPAVAHVLRGRHRYAELQERLKQLRSGANG